MRALREGTAPLNTPEHLDKAQQNELTAHLLHGLGHYDWAIVLVFYAALHFVQAYLAQQGHHPMDHASRNRLVRRLLAPIWRAYHRLYRFSLASTGFSPSVCE